MEIFFLVLIYRQNNISNSFSQRIQGHAVKIMASNDHELTDGSFQSAKASMGKCQQI